MLIVALAWIYVALMMAVAEATSTQGSVLGAVITFVLYGVLPLSILMYLMATPARRAALVALCEAAGCAPGDVRAWLGACIGPRRFEVGVDVLQAYGASTIGDGAMGFRAAPAREGAPKWLADLPVLARARLHSLGVRDVSAAERCTVEEPSAFFSFRRDGVCGRMAAAVWLR